VSKRVPYLEQLPKGASAEFYDPEGTRHGLPTCPSHYRPAHLLDIAPGPLLPEAARTSPRRAPFTNGIAPC